MKINEFFKDVLGQKLKNPMAWGAVLPSNVVAISVWEQRLVAGRVRVHSDIPKRTSNGNINNNWTERKGHFNLIKSGVPAVGILISNGDVENADGSWNIKDFNENSIFPLSDLRKEDDGEWSMKIDLSNPIPVEKKVLDVDSELAYIKQKHSKGYATINRAIEKFSWQLIGVTTEQATLTNQTSKKLMNIELNSGEYKVVNR